MFTRKLRYNKGSYIVTLPKHLIKHMGWTSGDKIVFEPNGKGLLLKKVEFKRALDMLQQEDKENEVFTIGYEGKDLEEFIDELVENGVKRLIDVREMPFSRKNGFSKNSLMKTLNKIGIEYRHFSELGAPKEVRDELKSHLMDFDEFAKLYKEHLERHIDDFKALEVYVSSKKSAIMCFESDWRRCHRSIIAEFLEKDGFEVIHL